jgi:undecaprenyl-diphosphatase
LNDYLLALILGIVEGLTEFLPVSSTAHLRIAQALLGHGGLSDSYWKMFSIVIQMGAILCLPIYFWGRFVKLFSTFPRGPKRDRTVFTHPLGLVIIAFVVTAIPVFALTKVIGKHLDNLHFIGAALLIGGIIMWMIDAQRAPWEKAGPGAKDSPIYTWKMDDMGSAQALWVGACQILSGVFPGTSRSMSTIAGGQLWGMSRAAALEFSFFLSFPTMLAATGYTLVKPFIGKDDGSLGVPPQAMHEWIVLGIGFVVSFIVGLASVAWFMAWVRRRGFVPFAIYRILLGIAVLAFAGKLAAG